MKKYFAALAILGAGVACAPAAQAKDLTGWFVNGAAGRVNYHATIGGTDLGSDHGTAGIVNFGYRTQFIGVEAGYTNLGHLSGSYQQDGYGSSARLSGDGWTLGINGHFNLTPQWFISARGGLFLWKLHARQTDFGPGFSDTTKGSTQSTDGYAGIGTGFDIDRHWSVSANFDYYRVSKPSDFGKLDIGNRVFTVGAEYRF
ncbi:MAG TPA: outer membrane beta-barrel protein [Dyella sp.]|nr:outer membrane beta-barrel protein [Dyella sp.]